MGERVSDASEWPNTCIWIFDYSGPKKKIIIDDNSVSNSSFRGFVSSHVLLFHGAETPCTPLSHTFGFCNNEQLEVSFNAFTSVSLSVSLSLSLSLSLPSSLSPPPLSHIP